MDYAIMDISLSGDKCHLCPIEVTVVATLTYILIISISRLNLAVFSIFS